MAILVLLLITPFLTELLSTNMVGDKFFSTLSVLLIIYGCAVLLIRELSIRWKLGLIGIFILGIAYGFYNEGIVAKTLLLSETVPMNSFIYPKIFGINWVWALFINVWHALHAVLYPILIVSYFFPKSKEEKWVRNIALIIPLFLVSLIGYFTFFNKTELVPFTPQVSFLYLFIAIIAILVIISKIMPKLPTLDYKKHVDSLKPTLLGASFFFVFTIGTQILAFIKVPQIIFFIAVLIILGGYCLVLKFKRWLSVQPLVLFGLGHYLIGVLWSLSSMKPGVIFTHPPFAVILVIIIWKVKKGS